MSSEEKEEKEKDSEVKASKNSSASERRIYLRPLPPRAKYTNGFKGKDLRAGDFYRVDVRLEIDDRFFGRSR